MEYCDSRRIKEIRDNTARIADAFNRIADEIQLFREAFVANNMSICESCANNPCNKKAMLGDRRIYECTLYERAKQTDHLQFDKDINVRSKDEPQTDCAWRQEK